MVVLLEIDWYGHGIRKQASTDAGREWSSSFMVRITSWKPVLRTVGQRSPRWYPWVLLFKSRSIQKPDLPYNLLFESRSRSLQNLNYLKTWITFPLLYTNFSNLDPDHSIHILFNPQFFLNPKLSLKLLFHCQLPIQIYLSHPCNLTSQKELLNILFPLQYFSHLPQKIKLAKSNCIFHSL